MSIGPSWPFTIGLLTFAFGAFFYFLWMLTLLKILDQRVLFIAISLMCMNIFMLLRGILQNPGIPQSIVDKILKDQMKAAKTHQYEHKDEEMNAMNADETS